MDIQDKLQTLYTSGTVFHAFLGEKLPNWKSAARLVRTIAENYKLPYYTLSPTYSVCKSHGYIAGEQFKCPECGDKTEVYSRITGYYRPVQNWNDGKAAEYNDRRAYAESKLTKKGPKCETVSDNEQPALTPAMESKAILIATPTCPNCRAAAMFLDKMGFDYEKVMADDNPDLVQKLGITQAPTLIISNGDQVELICNLSNIKAFAEQTKR